MQRDEFFEPWLGDIGDKRSAFSRLITGARVRHAPTNVERARSRFNGTIIGRGAGVARVLMFSRAEFSRSANCRIRRFMVNGRGGSVTAVRQHLRYMCRDGAARDGARPQLYGPRLDEADPRKFLGISNADRHQFRAIIGIDDTAEFEDLRLVSRGVMAQISRDLGVDLDWVAADHFDTRSPHTHVMIRGRAGDGANIVISPQYMCFGASIRASEFVSQSFGPCSEMELARLRGTEIEKEYLTQVDLDLLRVAENDGSAVAFHPDLWVQCQRAGRLQFLRKMGLAQERHEGRWELAPELAATLEAMGARNSRAMELDRERRALAMQVLPSDGEDRRPGAWSDLVGAQNIEMGASDDLLPRGREELHWVTGPLPKRDRPAGPMIDPLGQNVRSWRMSFLEARRVGRPSIGMDRMEHGAGHDDADMM